MTGGRETRRSATLVRLALLAVLAVPAAVTAQEPLPVEHAVHFVTLPTSTPPVLSPDGTRLAYTVEGAEKSIGRTASLLDEDRSARTEVRIVDLASGEIRRAGEPDASHAPDRLDTSTSTWAPSWSPDGSTLAYLAAVDGHIRLRVLDIATGRVRQVPDVDVWTTWTRDMPRWTPDGTRLVVKVLTADWTAGEALRRSEARAEAAGPPPDAPGGSTVRVFRSREASAGPGAEDPAPAIPAWMPWRYGGDVAVVDARSGAVERLGHGGMPVWWEAAPGGRRVAFTVLRLLDEETVAFRLVVADVDGTARAGRRGAPAPPSRLRELPGTVLQVWGKGVSWSPDGSRLAYLSSGPAGEKGLFVVDVEAGSRRRLAGLRPGWDVEAPPAWSRDGEALLLTDADSLWRVDATGEGMSAVATVPDHRLLGVVPPRTPSSPVADPDGTVLLRVRSRGAAAEGFARVDPTTGEVLALATEAGNFGGARRTDVSADGSTVVTTFSTTRHAPDLWTLAPGLERRRRASRMNPGFRPGGLGRDTLVTWSTADGERLEGTLLLPPEPDGGAGSEGRTGSGRPPLPLIVQVYGGGSGRAALDRFERWRQLLATRGFAVLVPDIPLEEGRPMEGHARAVLPALDTLVGAGLVDADRIGVWGHSYGGYGVLALLVASDRFRAAVASAAQGDMVGSFGQMAVDGTSRTRWAEAGQGRMGGTPWEVPEAYRQNSPVLHLDRVRTPLLLLHGEADPTVPVHLAEAVYVGLRRLGRPVALARYGGEGHWPGDWSVPNQIDYWTRLIGWFEERMGV